LTNSTLTSFVFQNQGAPTPSSWRTLAGRTRYSRASTRRRVTRP
jgi:hypothetical protein